MDNLSQLKGSATNVNNLLSKYIELHNILLKSTGSIWSIFKKINYSRYAGEAYFLFEQLRDERNNIEKLKNEASKGKEQEFAEGLFLYTKALTETVHLLFMLLHALKEKAEGGELSMKEHMENNKKYQESIKTYTEYGEDLNKLYSSL